jgi:hypothetical protein
VTAVLLFTTKMQSRDATLDPATSQWVYQCDTLSAPTALLAGDVSVALKHFYIDIAPGSISSVIAYMSSSLSAAAGLMWEAYDITTHLDGSNHGSPLIGGSYSITAFGGPGDLMPEGVAAALSYRSDYGTSVEFVRDPITHKVTGRPRARHRARVYLGPLNKNGFISDPSTGRTKLNSNIMGDFLHAFQNARHITDSASNAWRLMQWSEKDALTRDPVLAWMDDRPDYQRRRADQSTTRTQLVIT